MRILHAVVLVALLAGCTQTSVVEPVKTTTPAPTVAPVEMAPPIQVFDYSCSNIVEPKALRAAVSGAWVEAEAAAPMLAPRAHVVDNVGGIECGWLTDDNQGIWISAMPADAASAPEDTRCGFQTDASPFSCAIDVTSNGTRFAGLYYGASADALTATVGIIEALFAASALDAVAVTAPALATAWPSGLDCEALSVPGFTLEDASGGTDVFFSPAVLSLTAGITLPQCSIRDADARFSVLGGGRWMESAVRAAPGSDEVTVDGLELVILVPLEGEDLYSVNVFDGVNWLQVPFSDGDEKIYPVLVALVDALNHP